MGRSTTRLSFIQEKDEQVLKHDSDVRSESGDANELQEIERSFDFENNNNF